MGKRKNIKIEYKDWVVKDAINKWEEKVGIIFEEQFLMHLECKFDVNNIKIISAQDCGEYILIKVTGDIWSDIREFGFSGDGRLFW
jgi:hypothetical protein